MSGFKNSSGTDFNDLFEPIGSGTAQTTGFKKSDDTDIGSLFYPLTGAGSDQNKVTATGFKKSDGTDISSLFSKKGDVIYNYLPSWASLPILSITTSGYTVLQYKNKPDGYAVIYYVGNRTSSNTIKTVSMAGNVTKVNYWITGCGGNAGNSIIHTDADYTDVGGGGAAGVLVSGTYNSSISHLVYITFNSVDGDGNGGSTNITSTLYGVNQNASGGNRGGDAKQGIGGNGGSNASYSGGTGIRNDPYQDKATPDTGGGGAGCNGNGGNATSDTYYKDNGVLKKSYDGAGKGGAGNTLFGLTIGKGGDTVDGIINKISSPGDPPYCVLQIYYS